MAIVRSGDNGYGYVNGALTFTKTGIAARLLSGGTNSFRILSGWDFGVNNEAGKLSQISLRSVALSAEQVACQFNSTKRYYQ